MCWFRFEKNIVHDQGFGGAKPQAPLGNFAYAWVAKSNQCKRAEMCAEDSVITDLSV